MTHRDPQTWLELYKQWSSGEIPITGALLALVIGGLRSVYNGGDWKETALEGALCGLLTLSFSSALEYFGLPATLSPALGGLIGFMGVKKMRSIIIRAADKRTGNKP
ncbi:phage holin, lambda family [Escherichia coli]